jgi:hypothetical protein
MSGAFHHVLNDPKLAFIFKNPVEHRFHGCHGLVSYAFLRRLGLTMHCFNLLVRCRSAGVGLAFPALLN